LAIKKYPNAKHLDIYFIYLMGQYPFIKNKMARSAILILQGYKLLNIKDKEGGRIGASSNLGSPTLL
jgi:hypothetical protein